MIITCPSCLTRFRLDEARLTDPRAVLRCSRCSHVFPPPGGEAPTPAAAAESPAPEPATAPDSLSFSFDDDTDWTQETLDLEDIPEEQFSLNLADQGTDPAPPVPPRQRRRDATPRAVAPTPSRRSEPVSHPKEDPLANLQWDDPRDGDRPAARGGATVSLRPIFVFLALVVGAYAMLARTLYGNPEWADELMQTMPPLASVGDDRLLNRRVVLVEVEGRLQRTKEGEDVFLITGNAVNNAAVPLRNVQIIAKLLDATGKPLVDQVIFCGNSIPAKMLRDLSSQQVAIIPRLRPNNRFLIQPGDRAPFVIAFVNPPSTVAEFTTQVVSAQRQA